LRDLWLNECMLGNLFVGLILILIIVISSGVAVEIFEKLAHRIRTSKLLLATILVGFSTSLPELFVGIGSALRGQPQISLGDILGANLANLSWIIGGAAVLAGTIPVVGEYLKKDLWITMVAAMIPFVLMSDGSLSRIDGLILIAFYVLYLQDLIKNGNHHLKHLRLTGRVHHRLKTEVHWMVQSFKLVLALGSLAASSWMLINIVLNISASLGVSAFWVGLIVIAFGTTLPELMLSITASKKRDIALVLGNVLGSVVVNSTLILGIVAVINPIDYPESLQRGVAGIFLILVLGLFWLFTKSKHKLERWEGAVLVGVYAMFVGLQLMLA